QHRIQVVVEHGYQGLALRHPQVAKSRRQTGGKLVDLPITVDLALEIQQGAVAVLGGTIRQDGIDCILLHGVPQGLGIHSWTPFKINDLDPHWLALVLWRFLTLHMLNQISRDWQAPQQADLY